MKFIQCIIKFFKSTTLKHIDILLNSLVVICLCIVVYVNFEISIIGFPSTYAKAFNNLYANISYSFLAGYIFYLLTIKLPNAIKKDKASVFLKEKYNIIHCNILEVLKNYSYNKDIISISKEEYEKLFKDKSVFEEGIRYNSQFKKRLVIDSYDNLAKEIIKTIPDILIHKEYLSFDVVTELEKMRNSKLADNVVAAKFVNSLGIQDSKIENITKQLMDCFWSIVENDKIINIKI